MKRTLIALTTIIFILSNTPPRSVTAAFLSEGENVHTVQPGDNLYRLSVQYGTTVGALVLANNLVSPTIEIGQLLTIPSTGALDNPSPKGHDPSKSLIYVVKRGEYLGGIAYIYDTTIAAIMQANGLISTVIVTNQFLTIPAIDAAETTLTQPTQIDQTSAPSQNTVPSSYTVQRGDNLWRISLRFGTTVSDLMKINDLNSRVIFIGQRLSLPGGTEAEPVNTTTTEPDISAEAPTTLPDFSTSHVVQPGDNLTRIAIRYGTSVQVLMLANGLNSSLIFVGQRLSVPGTEGQVQTVPTPAPISTDVPTPAPTPAPAPAPIVAPSTSGSFGLGGQVAHFGGNAVSAMQLSGMTWVKRQVHWSPGANAVDQISTITDSHGKGFKILLSVIGGPNNAGPEKFPEYASFVGQLAANGADAIEVWNEQNLDREWAAGLISPSSYTELLKQSYNSIKAANGNTMVISGAPAPTGYFGGCTPAGCDDLPFLSSMVTYGALNYTDCVGIHYNEGLLSPTVSSGDPRGASSHYTRYYPGMVNTYWNAIGGARQLCFTEIGYLSGQEWGSLPTAFSWSGDYNMTVAQHAQYLGEAVSLARSQGKVRLFIVFNVDFTHYSDDPQAAFGMIRPDGSCPACVTLSAAMGQ